MKLILNLLIQSFGVFLTAYLLPGVKVETFSTAVIVALLLGIINSFLRPILIFLTLPLTILSLGLSIFIINGALIYLISVFIPEFTISSFFWAIIFSFTISIINTLLFSLTK